MTPASPSRAGTEAACHLIATLADASKDADRIDRVAEDVLGARYDDSTPVSDQSCAVSGPHRRDLRRRAARPRSRMTTPARRTPPMSTDTAAGRSPAAAGA